MYQASQGCIWYHTEGWDQGSQDWDQGPQGWDQGSQIIIYKTIFLIIILAYIMTLCFSPTQFFCLLNTCQYYF